MDTMALIREAKNLPLKDKILLIEETLRSIRLSTTSEQMNYAAESMIEEYNSNNELTAFTALDQEDFYETR